jgi:hypothetical protein
VDSVVFGVVEEAREAQVDRDRRAAHVELREAERECLLRAICFPEGAGPFGGSLGVI